MSFFLFAGAICSNRAPSRPIFYLLTKLASHFMGQDLGVLCLVRCVYDARTFLVFTQFTHDVLSSRLRIFLSDPGASNAVTRPVTSFLTSIKNFRLRTYVRGGFAPLVFPFLFLLKQLAGCQLVGLLVRPVSASKIFHAIFARHLPAVYLNP